MYIHSNPDSMKGKGVDQITKISTSQIIILSIVLFACLGFPTFLLANPEGGQVAAGQATISAPDAHTVQVNQASDKAVIDWRSFNIDAHETVRFQQPSRNSIILNRVDPTNGSSKIFGTLTANGHVWIVNPAGIFFGSTARVDVAGLVATTANIRNENFMAGNYKFEQPPDWHGSIINEGKITVADQGLAALVAPGVENRGVIVAKMGTVALAAGNVFTIDFYGDGLIHFGSDAQVTSSAYDETGRAMKNGVSNTGKIFADGGRVQISAQVASKIVENAINMEGYVQAKAAVQKGGSIILSGGDEGIVRVAGKMNVSGKEYGQKGGSIKIVGKKILVAKAKLNASGDAGGGEILIGGDYQGKNPLIPNAEYAFISSAAKINADALREGDGGKVIVWADKATKFYGEISARGGKIAGNGGFIETSGKEFLEVLGAKVNATATNGQAGTWLLDPSNINITTAADLRGSFDGGSPTNTFTPDGTGTANADVDTIIASLNAGTNVTITTTSAAAQAGNISLQSPIDVNVGGSGTATLTFDADNNINFNSSASNTITALSGILNVVFDAGATTTVSAAISTNGGSFTNTSDALTINAAINTSGGNFVNNSNSLTLNSSVNTSGGSFTSTTQNATTLGNGAGTTPGSVDSGAGTITFNVNADDLGANSFTMNLNSTLATTNATTNAIRIFVNNTDPGSGTGSGSATLRGITTGSGGTLTVTTDTGGNTTGGDILYGGAGIIDVGTGTITLSTPKTAGENIGTSGSPLQIKASTLNATAGSSGIFITNTGSGTLTVNTLHSERSDTAAAGTGQIFSNTAIQQGSNPIYVSTLTLKTLNDAGADITFNNANNVATTINLEARNLADTANANGTINYTDVDGFNITGLLTSGNANLTASGDITDSGTTGEIVGGTLTLAAGSANDITLNSTPNDFGTISVISANDVTLTDVNAIDLGAFNIANDLTVTADGAVTQSGSLISSSGSGTLNIETHNDGGADITLTNSSNEFATVTLQARNAADNANAPGVIQYRDATGFDLDSIRTSSDASFTAGGNITDGAASTVGGTLSFTAGSHDITVNNASNDFNTAKIISGNNVILRDANALIMDTSTISGLFTLTTAGAITQNGALTVSGTTTLNAGAANDITLTNSANNFSTVAITNGNNVSLVNSLGLILGTSTIQGALNITSDGDLTQSGAIDVTGVTTLAAGNTHDITLNNSANDFSTVIVNSGKDVNIRDTNSIILGASTIANSLTITSDNNVTQSGALSVPTLTVKTLNNAGGLITLTDVNNSVNSVNLQARNAADTNFDTGAINFVNSNGFDINTIGTLSTINLTALSGAITDSGSIRGSTLTTNSLGGTILDFGATLTGFNATNTGSGDIQLNMTATNALTISGINQSGGGNVDIASGGNVTLSGPVETNGGNFTLTHSGTLAANSTLNSGSGDITITSGEGSMTFADTIDANALTLNSGSLGNITFNGNVTIASLLSILNTNNLTNNATIQAGSYQQNAGNIANFGSSTLNVAGNAAITSQTVTGTLNVVGNLTVTGNTFNSIINVGSLNINVIYANLTGSVGGSTGAAGAAKIIWTNPGLFNTLFFDGIVLNPGVTPTPSLPQANAANLFPEYNPQNFELANDAQIQWELDNTQTSNIQMQTPQTKIMSSIKTSLYQPVEKMVPAVKAIFGIFPIIKNQFAASLIALLILLGAMSRRIQKVKIDNKNLSLLNLSDLSFNIRSSLNNLYGFAELISSEKFGTLSNNQKEFLVDIQYSVNELETYLTNQIETTEYSPVEILAAKTFKIRGLLNNIIGFAQLMGREKVEGLSAENNEYLNDMIISSIEISKFIDLYSLRLQENNISPVSNVF